MNSAALDSAKKMCARSSLSAADRRSSSRTDPLAIALVRSRIECALSDLVRGEAEVERCAQRRSEHHLSVVEHLHCALRDRRSRH
jgi:hypothetical protein